MSLTRSYLSALLCASLCITFAGCSTLQKKPTVCCDSLGDVACEESACDSQGCGTVGPRVLRGRSIPLLDNCGYLFGWDNKLALWDSRADNHHVSRGTESEVVRYLKNNQLDSVVVRSNQYDPAGEWQRLAANDRISAGWRYTAGALQWARYTLLPGRVFGGDRYNPFTDSIYLYSDLPAAGLTSAAYAKDVHSRDLPGTYASFQDLPLMGVWHETLASREILSYLGKGGSKAKQSEISRTLYPDFAAKAGSQLFSFFPTGSAWGRIVGGVAGRAIQSTSTQSPVHVARRPSSTY